MKRYIFLLAFVFLVSSQAARSEILFWWNWDCANGAASYTAGIKDDKTGKAFILFVDCDGSTCISPFDGGTWVKIGELTPPPNFRDMCIGSAQVTTPNTRVMFVLNGSAGDSSWFRTPADEAERKEYMTIWENMSRGLTVIKKEDNRRYTDTLQNALERTYAATVEKYGKTDVRATVSGSLLTITPLSTAGTNYVSVHHINGKRVWKGNVSTPVSLSLAAGQYQISGVGSHAVIGVPGKAEVTLH